MVKVNFLNIIFNQTANKREFGIHTLISEFWIFPPISKNIWVLLGIRYSICTETKRSPE